MKSLKIPDNKIYNAYLLEGEDAGTLEAAALDFARRILKDEKRVNAREHPDLIFLAQEKPGLISVDDVRKQIVDTAGIRPYEAEYKLYVIRNAEKMTVQAQNALLKTLEEPPAYTVIMLLTANANAFLATIRSRVVEFKAAEADAGAQFARTAQEVWAQETIRMLRTAKSLTVTQILDYIKQLHAEDADFANVLLLIELLLRDVLGYKCTGDLDRIEAKAAESCVISMANGMNFAQLGKASDAAEDAIRKLRAKVSPDLVMENLFLTLREE